MLKAPVKASDPTAPCFLYVYEATEDPIKLVEFTRTKYPEAKDGDVIVTLPDHLRYRNDCCYHINSKLELVPLESTNIDDYGHCNRSLEIKPGQPINWYCVLNAHNYCWWPSAELREFIKQNIQNTRGTGDTDDTATKWYDIPSDGHIFRFYINRRDDLDTCVFHYHSEEYEYEISNDKWGYVEKTDLGENYIICSSGDSVKGEVILLTPNENMEILLEQMEKINFKGTDDIYDDD